MKRYRMRYIALASLKDGKNFTEVADVRVTRHSVMRWLKWFAFREVDRLAGTPRYWGTQRRSKAQEEAFRQAVEQRQDSRGNGRGRGEDIRQLLSEQFAVAYRLNGVYDVLKRLDMAWISARSIGPHADPVKQTGFQTVFSALLVPGQAGWHTTPTLPQFPNVSLLSLPAGVT
jgi:transposase